MPVNCKFVSANNPNAIADYYMRETQPQPERDEDFRMARKMVPELPGTVPELRQDMPGWVADRMGLPVSRETPSREMIANLVAGKRADGYPTGKRMMTRGTRADGGDYRNKEFMDLILRPDISWGVAMANAETKGGRALLMSGIDAAAGVAMQHAVDRLGWTRRGAKGYPVQGEITWVRFPHHASRPTSEGLVSPRFHFHYVIPNVVLTNDGHMGAIHMRNLDGHLRKIGDTFENELSSNAAKLGVDIRRGEDGRAIIAQVPDNVRDFYSQNGREARENAMQFASSKGLDWESLAPRAQYNLMQKARNMATGSQPDGIADREQWRGDTIRLGWNGGDVVSAALGILASDPDLNMRREPWRPELNALQQAQQLKREMTELWQRVHTVSESVNLGKRLAPSLKMAATLAREFRPTVQRQALRQAQELRRMAQALARHPETAWRAMRVGAKLRRSGQAREAETGMAHVPQPQPARAPESPAPVPPVAPFKGVDVTERLVRIYARKISAGEMSMYDAIDRLVIREEEAVQPTGYNPVHHTYSYPKGSPGPENRYQREDKWLDRLSGAIDKLEAGTLWDDAFPKMKIDQAPEQSMKNTMRMQQ